MRHLSGRLLAAAAVVPMSILATASAAGAQSQPFDEPKDAAASWLVAQSDGPSWSGGDVATSLEATIGLLAAQVGGDQVQATLEWLNDTDTLTPYVYPTGEGTDQAALNAGAAGKVMYTVATAGGDPTNFGGIKLADEVAASQTETGAYGDGTAGSTAWAVLGLARTDAPAGPEAAAAFAAMQCPDGGFNFADVDGGDDCLSDPDTTGLVVSALATFDDAEALEGAVTWLESAQGENGGFDGGFGENANSTAMAAQAFFATGRNEAAEKAVAYLVGLQFDCEGAAPGAVMFTDPEDPDFGEAGRLYATAQALIPISGQSYTDLDGSGASADVPELKCGAEAASEEESDSASWLPWAIGAAVVVIAAIIVALALKARRSAAATKGSAADADEQ